MLLLIIIIIICITIREFTDVVFEDMVFDNNNDNDNRFDADVTIRKQYITGSQNYYYQTPHPQTPHP